MLTNTTLVVKGFVRVSTIADRLRELREGAGLSLQDVADRLKAVGYSVSKQTVSSYESESGTEKIPAAYVSAFCQAFEISASWLLLGEKTEGKVGEDAFSFGIWSATEDLVDMIDDLRRTYRLPPARRPMTKPEEAYIGEIAYQSLDAANESVAAPDSPTTPALDSDAQRSQKMGPSGPSAGAPGVLPQVRKASRSAQDEAASPPARNKKKKSG